MTPQPYIIEETFNAPVETAWRAITEKELMKQWYFDLPEFKAEVGCKFQIIGGPTPERQYVHLCEVLEVIPDKKLKHSWRYEGYEGNSFLTFELFAEGQSTRLKLTHEGLETFPSDNPDFAQENFAAGWAGIIKTSLKEFLEKT
ncbi:MAG: SRPBCC domain-containing protein [Ginsengibacter sp.]